MIVEMQLGGYKVRIKQTIAARLSNHVLRAKYGVAAALLLVSVIGTAIVRIAHADDTAQYSWSRASVTSSTYNHSFSSIAASADGSRVFINDSYGYVYSSTDSGHTWTERTDIGANGGQIAMSADGMKVTIVGGGGKVLRSIDGGATWTNVGAVPKPSPDAWFSANLYSSADGMRLVTATTNYIGTTNDMVSYLYVSTDGGATWAQGTESDGNVTQEQMWRYIAGSADGMKLVAVTDTHLWTSTDGGSTWTNHTGLAITQWAAVTSSTDGTHLMATGHTTSNYVASATVYISTDGGATWTQPTSYDTSGTPRVAAASASGNDLLLGEVSSSSQVSHDGGATWTPVPSSLQLATMSADGMKLIAAKGSSEGGVSYSEDGGATWTEVILHGSGWWSNVAMSGDGRKMYVVGDQVNRTVDGGATWTPVTGLGNHNWVSIATSADGERVVIVADDNALETSTDGGATWTNQTTPAPWPWNVVASSADGMKLVGAEGYDYIYTSTDGGVTWTAHTETNTPNWDHDWEKLAVSADGVHIAATEYNGAMITSDDSGATWIERPKVGAYNWSGVAISGDGAKTIATSADGLYVSQDHGATWTQVTGMPVAYWSGVAASADGLTLLATGASVGGANGISKGVVAVSADGGVTWNAQQNTLDRLWTGNNDSTITLSAHGKQAVIVGYSDYIQLGLRDGGEPYVTEPTAPAPTPTPAPTPAPPAQEAPRPTAKITRPSSAEETVAENPAPEEEPQIVADLSSDADFKVGKKKELLLSANQRVKFQAAREEHTVTLDKISDNSVVFTLRSTPQTVHLNVGETGKYDVTDDGKADISVTLLDITNGKAHLAFASLAGTNTAADSSRHAAMATEPASRHSAGVWQIVVWGVAAVAVVAVVTLVLRRLKSRR